MGLTEKCSNHPSKQRAFAADTVVRCELFVTMVMVRAFGLQAMDMADESPLASSSTQGGLPLVVDDCCGLLMHRKTDLGFAMHVVRTSAMAPWVFAVFAFGRETFWSVTIVML